MTGRKCKLHWKESPKQTLFGLIDVLHSTEPICTNCPRGPAISSKIILAAPRHARPLPQPNVEIRVEDRMVLGIVHLSELQGWTNAENVKTYFIRRL
jgi:hypothetical protein